MPRFCDLLFHQHPVQVGFRHLENRPHRVVESRVLVRVLGIRLHTPIITPHGKKGKNMSDPDVIARLEAIEQTISAGLVALVALVQSLREERDYQLLSSAQMEEAIEVVRHAARGLGYKFPAEV